MTKYLKLLIINMKILKDVNTYPEFYFNNNDHNYYFVHPYKDDWDVIKSPTGPYNGWNTSSISLAVCKDIRVANVIAKQMSEIIWNNY